MKIEDARVVRPLYLLLYYFIYANRAQNVVAKNGFVSLRTTTKLIGHDEHRTISVETFPLQAICFVRSSIRKARRKKTLLSLLSAKSTLHFFFIPFDELEPHSYTRSHNLSYLLRHHQPYLLYFLRTKQKLYCLSVSSSPLSPLLS